MKLAVNIIDRVIVFWSEKMNMEINSMEYWNHRFETDWNDFGGDQQTIFFANILCNLLPQWLIDETIENKYSVCDLGCADGNALPIWSNIFQNTAICGEDFSEKAIQNARKNYPEFMYLVSDILQPDGKRQYDVVISSNTVEHFKDTQEVLKNICRRSKRYTLILLPYREEKSVTLEHEVKFYTSNIPQIIEQDILIYAKTCLCHSQYYPGEQILLIYRKNPKEGVLSNLVEYVDSDAYKDLRNRLDISEQAKEVLEHALETVQKTSDTLEREQKLVQEKNKILEEERTVLIQERDTEQEKNKILEEEKAALSFDIDTIQETCATLESEKIIIQERNNVLEHEREEFLNTNKSLEQECLSLIEIKKSLEQEKIELLQVNKTLEDKKTAIINANRALEEEKARFITKIKILEEEKTTLEKKQQIMNETNESLILEIGTIQEQNEALESKIVSLENELENAENKRIALESRINRAVLMCEELTNWGLYKFSHMLHRTKHQLFNRSGAERRQYMSWLSNYLKGNGTDSDRRFKPVYRIADILKGQNDKTNAELGNSQLGNFIEAEGTRLDDGNIDQIEVDAIKNILRTRTYKGILVYPHVVYWEPLQTPQQLLRSFANLGWLCFFCEHPNLSNIFREVESNVIIVHEKEYLHAASEQEVVVLMTWLGSCAFLDRLKNKKVWYHILDKLNLFPYYDNTYLKLHECFVNSADCVSYVASLLTECIQERSDAIYLPNGVNPEEFINIHKDFVPEEMKYILKKGHKIIGYYGYLAEWMDYELVRRLALARPNYEFVFIGKAIFDISLLQNITNIHLLGLKPYKDLSDYAKFFDVAVIPFVINETMDCVSPIKFYEYCALGLPVITSKMREMEKYVCDYVACADGLDEFLFYLDKLTDTKYKEMATECAPQIAQDNTWLERAKIIQSSFDKELSLILGQTYKKFDVIILGVIDYDFRFQRPQQLAVRYAQNGHRVFYFNANHFRENAVYEIQKNLYVLNIYNDKFSAIHLTDWQIQRQALTQQVKQIMDTYCIRDAMTIVDYPNWIYAAEYLRESYGFKIITDYMDDYTGFLNPAEELVRKNCERLLGISDGVITSSKFLYDIALKYNQDVTIVRNGTEFEHFYKAFGAVEHKRKIIGYYGAVAEWFQTEKVVYLAQKMPECDFVIIGQLTRGEDELQRFSNIKLLGEKSYYELPEYLQTFDVCIIPFDTSTDLIKATNPVKFYEYLSAGKKIVATEIPELEIYKDRYVYMANENEQFLSYVKMCLEGTDTLCNAEECIHFARQHDWQERYDNFYAFSKKMIPKVQIIVLTYNNLEVSKLCIKSILEKTAYPNYELIIVDNCSVDGTRAYLTKLAKEQLNVRVIFNEKNTGFAAGNNVGIKNTDGAYVVLLNNDTVVTRGWLTALTKHMEQNSRLGMCGPVTNSIGNEAKIKVNYHSMREFEQFSYEYTTKHLGEKYHNINVLALFCTIIRRQVIDECGYLDENYGIGMFEDDDYAEAVKKKGYTLSIAEDSFIHHFEGVSFKKIQDEAFMELFYKNKDLFEQKWNTVWKKHKNRPGVAAVTNLDCTIV